MWSREVHVFIKQRVVGKRKNGSDNDDKNTLKTIMPKVHLVVAGEGLTQKQLVGFHRYALANSVTHTFEVAVRWMASMP